MNKKIKWFVVNENGEKEWHISNGFNVDVKKETAVFTPCNGLPFGKEIVMYAEPAYSLDNYPKQGHSLGFRVKSIEIYGDSGVH
jgi:hypothetical protein